ncbi:MAG: glycerophosphodiester phosphodiesterase [Oscillospiraceae bacterium]|nr:glycerophosphodiester phosphodiesterase [Oscillospiraceae bacterium]
MVFLIIIAVLSLLYILSVRGRTGHPGLAELKKWSYAHRGLHDEILPENSMAAFRAALDHGYGIELDIHLLKDGNLGVMHDSKLMRTTGAEGKIEDLTTQELKNYHLGGTDETIPEFRQVLELFAGKAPLVIELKADGSNSAALCEAACKMMEGYHGPFCMESFDPRCIWWLKKNRPEIIRGQLTENYFATGNKLPWILKFLLKYQIENFLGKPDFVAYRFSDRKNISNALVRKLWGVQGFAWTLDTKADYETAVSEGWVPIFEKIKP